MTLYSPFNPPALPVTPDANNASGRNPGFMPPNWPPAWHLDVMAKGPVGSSIEFFPEGQPTTVTSTVFNPHTRNQYRFEFHFPDEFHRFRKATLSGGELAFSFGGMVQDRLPFNATLPAVEHHIARAARAVGIGPLEVMAMRNKTQGLDITLRLPGRPGYRFPELQLLSSVTTGGTIAYDSVFGGHTLVWPLNYGEREPVPTDVPAAIRPALESLARDEISSNTVNDSVAFRVPWYVSQPLRRWKYESEEESPVHWQFGLNLKYSYYVINLGWVMGTITDWSLVLSPNYQDRTFDSTHFDVFFPAGPTDMASWNGGPITLGAKRADTSFMGPRSMAMYELPDFLTLRPLYSFTMDAAPDSFPN